MLAKRGGVVQEGDLVIVFHGYDDLRPLKVQRGLELHCREGRFRHNDIIGTKYGTRVRGVSNTKADDTVPTLLVLQNSADVWTAAVPHRTQIIYATDIACIVMNLRVRPGSVVAEAGTGSGSLTHSFARAVAPNGHVYTFDFHRGRATQAREEFAANGVGHLVTVDWRDVCTTGIPPEGHDAAANGVTPEEPCTRAWWTDETALPGITNNNRNTSGAAVGADVAAPLAGYGLRKHSVDAVFLDVPAPWLAIDNVLHVLRPGGILCTFSPCIEQTQRTCERLRADPSEFVDCRTVEALTKYFEPVFKRRTQTQPQQPCEARGSNAPSAAESPTVGDVATLPGAERKRPRYTETIHFKPESTSKGHSAYLTFARRRLSRASADGATIALEQ